jgi:hypothetical protein
MPNNILLYPFSTPIILTDAIFTAYDGKTGTSTAAERQIAYFLAEVAVSTYLGTLLTPTIVTGTYEPTSKIKLDHAYVWSIRGVTFWSIDRLSSCTLSSSAGCAYLSNGQYGIAAVNYWGSCACGGGMKTPFQVEIAYQTGLPSGTVYTPTVLGAMTLVAQSELNEMSLASQNESPGDVGVVEWSNQEYSEKRVSLIKTSLGSSAVANRARRLLMHLRRTRVGGIY